MPRDDSDSYVSFRPRTTRLSARGPWRWYWYDGRLTAPRPRSLRSRPLMDSALKRGRAARGIGEPMPGTRSHAILRYVVAAAAVALAALARLGLSGVFQFESPFMLFLGAVMAAAWYGGLGPGLLAT